MAQAQKDTQYTCYEYPDKHLKINSQIGMQCVKEKVYPFQCFHI